MCAWLEVAGAACACGAVYPRHILITASPQIKTVNAVNMNLDLRKFIHYLLEALE
jgi:hypothetical protein